jgi:purine-binding chemotaxis protein CheW
MPEAADCTTCKLMIVSLARQTLALVVDNVMEIITVPVGDITPPQDTMHANVLEHLLGICHSDDSVFMILDIDSLKVFS